MSSRDDEVNIWWIDDDHADADGPRQGERKALETQASHKLRIEAIHPAEIEDFLSRLTDEPPPDLMLIDYRLNHRKHQTKDTPFFARDGLTLRATLLRENRLKHVPAYLVSQVIKEEQTGSTDDLFDWVLTHQQLTTKNGGPLLRSDALDYRSLRVVDAEISNANTRQDTLETKIQVILELLKVPEESQYSLNHIIEQKVSSHLRSQSQLDTTDLELAPSLHCAIARWVRSTVLKIRGPLIDNQTAAVMAGSSLGYFTEKLKPQLELDGIEYTGIFHSTASMTLWRQSFLETLVSLSPTIDLSSPKNLAQSTATYLKVPRDEQSRCLVCNESWPETIAFDEEDPTDVAPVHWRCSEESTQIDAVIGFDVPRSFSN